MTDLSHFLGRPPGEVLLEARSAPVRRAIGVVSMATLGALVAWLGVNTPAALALRALLVVLGLMILVVSVKLWEASGRHLVLTSDRLTDSTGAVLANVAEIRSIARGALAIKPSNGFLLTLDAPQGSAWVPGVWWRIGRWVGVGGLTNAGQVRALGEVLQVLTSERRERHHSNRATGPF